MPSSIEKSEAITLQPLLDNGYSSNDNTVSEEFEQVLCRHDRRYISARVSSWLIVIQLFALAINVAIFLFLMKPGIKSMHGTPNLLPLPAREALKWELRPFVTNLDGNPFAGAPRSELDHAWHEMLQSWLNVEYRFASMGLTLWPDDNIRLPSQDIQALGLDSVYVKDSLDMIASLSSFHALHCLKKTRHMVHRQHYHRDKNEIELAREESHVNHCMEYLREYLLCHPDISLITFHWINETSKFEPSERLPTNGDHSLHECANWDSLNDWAGERKFNLYQYDGLKKPEHGLHY